MVSQALTTLLLASLQVVAGGAPSSNVKRDVDRGTFSNPSIHVRPRFRYWLPDASADHAIVARDVKSAAEVGLGGLEVLGFYLYGGPSGGSGIPPVSWATYGFGTDAWNSLFKSTVQAAKDNNILIDFPLGPNQGTGVPAPDDDDGLMWDLKFYNTMVPLGGSFNAVLPGWGSGKLEAAVTGLVTKSEVTSSVNPGLPGDYGASRTQFTVANSSLTDVTSQVGTDGRLNVTFPANQAEGLNNIVFALYLFHSHWRAQDGPKDLPGPQTPAQTIAQNGSWAVDHFSARGAATTSQFWENNILQNGTKELLREVGYVGWEDSIEIQSNMFYTKDMQSSFFKDHGYSLGKYLPVLFHRDGLGASSNPSQWFITDEPDSGLGRVADFRDTLAKQYREYLGALSSWARESLGLQFSAQVSYNLPMDMLANIPAVDVPECESLDFSDLIDGYRQYSGPAHLAGKLVVSSECGAVPNRAYSQTMQDLLWKVQRSYAGSINQFVFHGLPYSGNYGNTTWPAYTTFNYRYSDMHGPHQPSWAYMRPNMDFVARGNHVLQTGTLRRDVAFWQKRMNVFGHTSARTYSPTDLELAGYTYEYLSPDNLAVPNAVVKNGVLAPDAQAFKALVLRSSDAMTLLGAAKVVEYAHAGLPILFVGGVPTSFLGTDRTGAIPAAQAQLQQLTSLANVHVTGATDSVAATLATIGVRPATALRTGVSSWYTLLRTDDAKGVDYYFVYNDAPAAVLGHGASTADIEFASTGYPIRLDLWTGKKTPLLVYSQDDASTTIRLNLAGNQSTVIAFSPRYCLGPKPATKGGHLEAVSANVLDTTVLANGSIALKAAAGPAWYTTAAGQNVTATVSADASLTTLTGWKLTVEHWDPPADLMDIEGGATKHNTTHGPLASLVSWKNIDGLQTVSGRGFYSTTFTWKRGSSNSTGGVVGAIVDFGPVLHTLAVRVNGHAVPPLDITSARADITQWLVDGQNTIEAEVSTPLGNVLAGIWGSLLSSGGKAMGSVPAINDYGLIKDVTVQSYSYIIVN